jgi:hypothetical protein
MVHCLNILDTFNVLKNSSTPAFRWFVVINLVRYLATFYSMISGPTDQVASVVA